MGNWSQAEEAGAPAEPAQAVFRLREVEGTTQLSLEPLSSGDAVCPLTCLPLAYLGQTTGRLDCTNSWGKHLGAPLAALQ